MKTYTLNALMILVCLVSFGSYASAQDFVFEINPATGDVIFVNETGSSASLAGYTLDITNALAGSFATSEILNPFGESALNTSAKVSGIGLLANFDVPAGSTSLGTGVFVANGAVTESDFGTQVTGGAAGDIVFSSGVRLVPEPGVATLVIAGSCMVLIRRRDAA